MNLSLPFETKIKSMKRKKTKNRNSFKIRTDHTQIEIQNMDMPHLEYLYEHGSPAEKEMADRIIRLREKWDLITLPNDDVLPSGSGSPAGTNYES